MKYSTSPAYEAKMTQLLAGKGDRILKRYSGDEGYSLNMMADIHFGAGVVIDVTACLPKSETKLDSLTDKEYKAIMQKVNTKLRDINTELKKLEAKLNKKDVLLPVKMIEIKPMLLLGKKRHTVIDYKNTEG